MVEVLLVALATMEMLAGAANTVLLAGLVMLQVGAVSTVMLTALEVPVLLLLSVAMAVSA